MFEFKSNKKFELEVCCALAEGYTAACHNVHKQFSGFVASMVERYQDACNHNAVVFGPFAFYPHKDKKWWTLKDLRGGWGYSPLNLDVYVEDGTPTFEDVLSALKDEERNLRRKADCLKSLTEQFSAQ